MIRLYFKPLKKYSHGHTFFKAKAIRFGGMMELEFQHKEHEEGGEVQAVAEGTIVGRATWYYKNDLSAIAVDHVVIKRSHQGIGLGTRLMDELIHLIRSKEKKFYPECTFAKEYAGEHIENLKNIIIT